MTYGINWTCLFKVGWGEFQGGGFPGSLGCGWTNPCETYARQIGSWNPNFRSENKDHLWNHHLSVIIWHQHHQPKNQYTKQYTIQRENLSNMCHRLASSLIASKWVQFHEFMTSVAKSLKKWQKKHFYHLIPPQIELFDMFRKCLRLCFGSFFFRSPGRLEVSTLPNARPVSLFDSPVTRLEQYSARMVLTGFITKSITSEEMVLKAIRSQGGHRISGWKKGDPLGTLGRISSQWHKGKMEMVMELIAEMIFFLIAASIYQYNFGR